MEGLNEQEKKFFESSGEAPVEEAEETPEVVEAEEVAEPEKPERKRPSKFSYSEDTDNVVDDLGRKYIPLGAVQEARNENKELRRQLKEQMERFEVGNRRLQEIMQRVQSPEQKAEIPAYEENPLEHLRAQNEALVNEIKSIKEGSTKQQQLSEQQAQLHQFANRVKSMEAKFRESNKDYDGAVEHIKKLWVAELEVAGVPAENIDPIIANRGAQIAYLAMQAEKNPAEAVYELARRVGYKPVVAKKDSDNLKTIAQGMQASKSLSGGQGDATLSLEAIANWSDDDYEQFVAKKWGTLARAV